MVPAAAARPTVLYLHGNGGSIAGRTGQARRIAGRRWGLMMLEYRGYGGNPGTPSKAGLAADAQGALNALAAPGVLPNRVVLYGESLGTGVAVRLAAAQPAGSPIAAAALDAPYTSVADAAQFHYPFVRPACWYGTPSIPSPASAPSVRRCWCCKGTRTG